MARVNAEYLRQTVLWGLDWDTLPCAMFDLAIDVAYEIVSADLGGLHIDGIKSITPGMPTEGAGYDATYNTAGSHYQLDLNNAPIRKINDVSFWFGDISAYKPPSNWWTIRDHTIPRIEIITGNGAWQQLGIDYSPGFISGRQPAYIHVSYDVGYGHDQSDILPLPARIKYAVALAASVLPLRGADAFVGNPGLVSWSKSLDGLNQNFGLTRTTSNSAYAYKVNENMAEYSKVIASLASSTRVIPFFIV